MSGLPKGWVEATLGEICQLQNGRAYKQEELLSSGKYPVLRVGNFFTSQKWYYSDLELEANKYCDDEDLLYAWSASFGPRIWSGGKVIFHYHIWRVDLEKNLSERDFVFHWFNWDKENIKAAHGTGSTMIHVTKGDMEQRRISLPPLAEQKRIVAKLEALNAKSARGRTELARIETLISRYKQAVLSKAFSGELGRKNLGELVTRIKAGKNLRCEERPPQAHEKGVVKVSAVTWGEFRANQSKTLPRNFEPDEDARIKTGDFLFSRANTIDLVGAVVIVANAPDNLYLSDKILRLEFSEPMDSWLLWYLRSPMGRETLMNISSGNQLSMRNIGQKNLLSLSIPYANGKSRNEIVRRIEAAFARIDRLAGEAKRALALVDRLDEAILAKAFRGELVPQDETDEPAERLLARIRAERQAAPKARRGRRAKA